jgi:hypothetical protein
MASWNTEFYADNPKAISVPECMGYIKDGGGDQAPLVILNTELTKEWQ